MEWFAEFWHWWTTGRIATTAAAIGAGSAVYGTRTAVRTLRHNRRATQQSTRPMMVATLRATGDRSAGIEVTNAGKSIARNVVVTFDPPLPTHEHTPDGQLSMLTFIRRRYSKPVDTWVPGTIARSEFLTIVGGPDEQGRLVNADGIPRDTWIVFAYEDDNGTTYTDRISLDPTLLEGETWSEHIRRSEGQETVLSDAAPWVN